MGKDICAEVDEVFYKSLRYAGECLKHDEKTIKRRCLSNKFPDYEIVPFKITYTHKKCAKCENAELLKEFYVCSQATDGLSSWCKTCVKKYQKEHSEKYPEQRKGYDKAYRKTHKEQINKRQRENGKNNPTIRLTRSIRSMVNYSLNGRKHGKHLEALVGYTLEELKAHLESLFTEGMSWENYGRGGWVLDHKTPICKWDITSVECQELKDCWSLNNLQPLWELRNKEKGAKPMHPKYLIKPDWIK